MSGPRQIPQGEWTEYTVKVYLQRTSQFRLTLDQEEGNEISDLDSVSVGDIQVLKIGNGILSCTELPVRSFRVSCKKLRKGDSCSIDSPVLHFCPPVKGNEARHQNESMKEETSVEFRSIVYGLPSATPESHFTLRAHVEARYIFGDSSTDVENEARLSGIIVRRQRRFKSWLDKDHHDTDGRVAVMPTLGGRHRRSLPKSALTLDAEPR